MDINEFNKQTIIKLSKFVEDYTAEAESDPVGFPDERSFSVWLDEFRVYVEAVECDKR